MNSLQDKVAIVTGASKGIGKEISIALAQAGVKVVLAARSTQELESVASHIQSKSGIARAIKTDITSPEQIESLVEKTITEFGRIDILVNNAGIGVFKPLAEMDISEFDAMWNVNMRGVFLMTKGVLPHMINANAGAIVNISSLAGKNGFVNGTGYAATKWGLRGFASCLMLEVRQSNIRVVTIFPGSVDTTFSSKNLRGEKITQPEDVADAVLFAISAPQRTMISEIDIRPTNPK